MRHHVEADSSEQSVASRRTLADVSPSARELARQALRLDAADRPEPEALAEAAERAFARLRARLANLIGLAGYRALFARAVRMAQVDYPTLGLISIDVQSGGSPERARAFAFADGADPADVAAGLTAIFAQLIDLLITFIGEDLTIQLTREALPEIADVDATPERRA